MAVAMARRFLAHGGLGRPEVARSTAGASRRYKNTEVNKTPSTTLRVRLTKSPQPIRKITTPAAPPQAIRPKKTAKAVSTASAQLRLNCIGPRLRRREGTGRGETVI